MAFHTPNGLGARHVTPALAELLVRAGVRTFYLSLESGSPEWQRRTGGKVEAEDLARAVEALVTAGAGRANITVYLMLGHPRGDLEDVESSLRFVHDLGIRSMLADFSPIPGTPDGEACRRWADLDEPLLHSKTAFPILCHGAGEVNRLKQLCRDLNASVAPPRRGSV